MQVSTANNVKVYNLSVGKSLPEWISDRKKRALLKEDIDLRRRIELIQDFSMPTASTDIQATADGQYIIAAGVYKPRVRCYDVNQLSMKFERCLDAEGSTPQHCARLHSSALCPGSTPLHTQCWGVEPGKEASSDNVTRCTITVLVRLTTLSEDYSKFVLLLADRHLEFHAQYGFYYRTRIPRFGRDLAYHYPSCDLYITSCCPEIYRLNLEQGRFLNTITTKSSACNVCEFNPEHQLLAVGTEDGSVECWDPRSRARASELSLSVSGVEFTDQEGFSPSVTALKYNGALNLAVGTATGQVLLYDLRSSRPRLVKDHHYGLAVHSIDFQKGEGLVLSADSRSLRIWQESDASPFTAIEPDPDINRLCYLPGTGLLFMATEDTRMLSYYIPSLGPAPRWCSFLDSLTEELEETPESTVYEDYKFVTSKDLAELNLSHLIGTNLLRAYMHGYFMDIRLYHKARSIAQPFAYEQYRKEKIRKKMEEVKANRVRQKKLPTVNKQLAERLLGDSKAESEAALSNPLGDDRFAAMFTNPEFQVDEESEEFQLLHPVLSQQEKRRSRKTRKRVELQQQQQEVDQEEEPEGRPSEDESSSSEDEGVWRRARRVRKSRPMEEERGQKAVGQLQLKTLSQPTLVPPQHSRASLGQRLERGESATAVPPVQRGSTYGSREATFSVKKSEAETKRTQQQQEHRAERRKLRRSASSILPQTRKLPVFWKGRKIK